MCETKPVFGYKISLLVLVFLDMCVLVLTSVCVVIYYYLHGAQFSLSLYQHLAWTPLVFLGIAISSGLYPGYLRTPPEELKLLSWSTSFFFLVIGCLTFFLRSAEQYSRFIFLFSWLCCLISLPITRLLARKFLGRFFTWGYPCVVIGEAARIAPVIANIRSRWPNTLRPVAVVTETGFSLPGLTDPPVIPISRLAQISTEQPHCHAILLYSPQSSFPPSEYIAKLSLYFKSVLLTSDKIGRLSLWMRGVDVGGCTFVMAYFKLLDPARMRLKRLFDIVLCAAGSLVALPLIGLIALAIKLDSVGPVFFKQTRLGQHGREFQIFKFRTMFCDAQSRLTALLVKDKQRCAEWQANQKLACDPRITRIGKLLRVSSLDELPQFFNVLTGAMSLVGPRPIVEAEISKYAEQYEIYKRLKPGITGLWQVSGRNRTTYEQRVAFDDYYVRNWSIWMDVWIIMKTVLEVLRGGGA